MLLLVLLAIGCDAEPVGTPEAPVETTASDGPDGLSDQQLETMRAREPERAARALAEVQARFGQRDPDLAFRIARSTTTALGDAHVLVQQVYRGMPVEDREIHVIVGVDEKIRILGEPDRFDGVSVPRAATALDPAHAWAFQRGATLTGARERQLEPVYERRLRPGTSGGNAADWEDVVVGWESGTRVEVRGGRGYDGARALFVRDRDGAVFERDAPTQVLEAADLRGHFQQTTEYPETQKDDTLGSYHLEDEFGNTVHSNGATYFSADNIWGDGKLYDGFGGTTLNGETAGADAMISIWATSKMYQMVYRQAVKPTWVIVHFPRPGAENFVGNGPEDPDTRFIRCGYADVTASPETPMTDIEVIAHEYGHLSLRDKTGIEASGAAIGELNGIAEGSADIFGLNAHFYLPGALNPRCIQKGRYGTGPVICMWPRSLSITNNWIFGDVSNQPAAVRSFLDPKIPAWSADIAKAPGHEAGGPLRRMYYFLSVGVQESGPCISCYDGDGDNLPQRTSMYLPQGLVGVGLDVASKIWWRTIDAAYIQGVKSYAEYREAMLLAATDLYGKDSTQYKAVEDAWAAVNVGKPADRKGPEIQMLSGMVLKTGSYVEVTATDENGVALVEFYYSSPSLGYHKIFGAFTAPPYRVQVGGLPTTDTYTLTFEATDNRGNKSVRDYSPVTFDGAVPDISLGDVTPCSPATSEWCGDWCYQRMYRVTASAVSGIQSVTLWKDGMPVGTYAGSSHDFVVPYTVTGPHVLWGATVNGAGTGNKTAQQTFDIDLTAPTVTRAVAIAQSQSAYSGEYIDNLVEIDYCAHDPSGMALRAGKQRIDLTVDGVARTAEERAGYPAGCPSYYVRNVSTGTHSFYVRIYDKWGNYAEAQRTVNVVAVKPSVYLYPVYVDPAVLGTIDVHGWYLSTGNNIASIAFYTCRQGSVCVLEKSEPPPPGYAGGIDFHFKATTLWPGETYKVQITVTGTNGTSTTVESQWFTIPTTITPPPPPPPQPHVYDEVEPNNGTFWQYMLYGTYDVVPGDTDVIRGNTSGNDGDLFVLTPPAGKALCVAGSRAAPAYAPLDSWMFWYRASDGLLNQAYMGISETADEISDSSYACYFSQYGDGAIDGKFYLLVQGGPGAAPEDYEIHIKYVPDMYFAPPAPSL